MVIKLSDDWLDKYKTHVDYVSITCVIQKGKQNILLQTNPWMHWAPKSSTKGLSTMQFKRARNGAMPILSQLTKVDDRETSSQLIDIWCLAALLEKFEDVYELLPSGLSCERKMAHTVILEKGDKLPFKLIYHVNPKELEEAKRQVQEHLERAGLSLVPRLIISHSFCTEEGWNFENGGRLLHIE